MGVWPQTDCSFSHSKTFFMPSLFIKGLKKHFLGGELGKTDIISFLNVSG